jgi:hypothetical protein
MHYHAHLAYYWLRCGSLKLFIWTANLQISASQVAGIIGMSHHVQPEMCFKVLTYYLKQQIPTAKWELQYGVKSKPLSCITWLYYLPASLASPCLIIKSALSSDCDLKGSAGSGSSLLIPALSLCCSPVALSVSAGAQFLHPCRVCGGHSFLSFGSQPNNSWQIFLILFYEGRRSISVSAIGAWSAFIHLISTCIYLICLLICLARPWAPPTVCSPVYPQRLTWCQAHSRHYKYFLNKWMLGCLAEGAPTWSRRAPLDSGGTTATSSGQSFPTRVLLSRNLRQ